MGVVFFQKQFRKIYNEKYGKNYSNQYYVIKKDFIKDAIIH